MKTIKVERAHVYNFGFSECLMYNTEYKQEARSK